MPTPLDEMADPSGETVASEDELSTMAKSARPMTGIRHGPLQIDPVAGGAALPTPAIRPSSEPAPFPQYRENYPTSVAGTVKPKESDPRQTYAAKAPTPEEIEFQKRRAATIDAMKSDPAWNRYFKTEERYPVPRQNFPAAEDTAKAVAARPETIAKHETDIFTPTHRRRLQKAGAAGQDPSTQRWYDMGQLHAEFVRELGPVAGSAHFRRMFSAPMAATTGGADPRSNLIAAYYGNWLRTHGIPFPRAGEGWQIPYPVGGGKYGMVGNLQQYNKLLMDPKSDVDMNIFNRQIGHNSGVGAFLRGIGMANPKRLDFMQDLEGHTGSAVMDEQMMRGLTSRRDDPSGIGVPKPGTYGIWQRLVREEAAKAGLDPSEFQGRAWHGFKNYTQGKPMIENVNEMIERTHRLTGMDPADIVKYGLIYGRIPLFGIAALSFMADQDRDDSKRNARQDDVTQ